MKARFGTREPKEINPLTEYILDNGYVLQLFTNDGGKKKHRNYTTINNFTLSKKSFTSLLKRDLIYLNRENGSMKYYFFRGNVQLIDEVI